MKKLVLAAALFAGMGFGFANEVKQSEATSVSGLLDSQKVINLNVNLSNNLFINTDAFVVEALLKAICKDIHAFFNEVELPNGEIELVFDCLVEITYECDKANTNLHVWSN